MTESQLLIEIFSALRGHGELSPAVSEALVKSPLATDMMSVLASTSASATPNWLALLTALLQVLLPLLGS